MIHSQIEWFAFQLAIVPAYTTVHGMFWEHEE